jgi:hypothetical protein
MWALLSGAFGFLVRAWRWDVALVRAWMRLTTGGVTRVWLQQSASAYLVRAAGGAVPDMPRPCRTPGIFAPANTAAAMPAEPARRWHMPALSWTFRMLPAAGSC